MSKMNLRALACTSLGVFASAAAWAQAPAKPDAPSSKEAIAAIVGSELVTIEELDAVALKTNMKLAQSLYDARRAALDQIVMERILGPEAATRKITVDQLIKERIAEKAKPVTDADVEAYFNANKARMGAQTLEQTSARIRTQLTSQGENEARANLLTQLKEKAGVRVTLDPPRAEVALAANDPTDGPKDAKVTIVEFSDFQ